MLSRRDKLYVQPWEHRRFQDHRAKVLTALPAIDDRAPAARAHVTVKLKKFQRETERARKIEHDNYSLLQRLEGIMRRRRLDNQWDTPLPKHKVGMFHDAATLRGRVAARASAADAPDDYIPNVKCYACYNKRKSFLQLTNVYGGRGASLPNISPISCDRLHSTDFVPI